MMNDDATADDMTDQMYLQAMHNGDKLCEFFEQNQIDEVDAGVSMVCTLAMLANHAENPEEQLGQYIEGLKMFFEHFGREHEALSYFP